MGLELDLARTALLVLDLQNYNVHPDGYWNKAMPGTAEAAVPMIEGAVRALAASRSAGIMVIHARNSWREGHPDINPHAPWMADAKAANRSTTAAGEWSSLRRSPPSKESSWFR